MPTIHEVAAACGVSPRTVSRVMNDRAHVRPETRAKVLDIALRMGYNPDPNAQALQSGRKRVIGIVANAVSSDSTLKRIEVISRLFNATGYAVLVQFADSGAMEEEAVRAVAPRCDALVVFSNLQEDRSIVLDGLLKQNYPFILVDPPRSAAYPSIHLDRSAGYRDAVKYLSHKGRKHILLLIEEFRSSERIDGFRRGLEESGLDFHDQSILRTDKGFSGGSRAADVIQTRFNTGEADAVLCHNDKLALGLLRGLQERGIKVPEQLSLIGFDDEAFSAYLSPPLTTIVQSGGDVGAYIFNQIRNKIEYDSPVESRTFGTALLLREST